MSNLLLTICHNNTMYKPIVEEGIEWTTELKGVPGELRFKVVNDDIISFTEGDAVRLTDGDKKLFFGFVFSKKRDKNGVITVVAYDQLRYLKNKDIYTYENKTASEFLKMLIQDFNLRAGEIDNTEYVIPRRIEDNVTLFDMIQNALDETLQYKKKLYVLYDDFGKINLKNIENMKLNLVINDTTAENFDYTSSINTNTYNKIKLVYDNQEAGTRDVYVTKDTNNINTWGVLQYFEKIQEDTNGKLKADTLLNLYNKKTRNLTISNALGDNRVRAGNSVIVNLNLGDVILQNYMVVERVKHKYDKDVHLMDLTLKGGDFVA